MMIFGKYVAKHYQADIGNVYQVILHSVDVQHIFYFTNTGLCTWI